MNIKKLQIQNFEGFNGTYEYEFKDPLNALCLKNGAGKTSFLNALRYGITGIKPVGKCINNDANTMAVGLTFHDGVGIIRQDYTDKSSRYFLKRRPVSKKVLDEYLQSRAGVAQSTMKIATSTDVLAGLKPQEFGELLLSYIPESLTRDKIIKMLGHLSVEEKALIDDFFPDDKFGTEMIDAFHKHLFDLRKSLNKKISECEAYLNHFADVPATDKTEEDIQKELDILNKKQGSVNLYKEQKKNFDIAVKRKTELEKGIVEIQKKIDDIGSVSVDPVRFKENSEKIESARKNLLEINTLVSSIEQMCRTLTKALDDINKPVCPLSEKLKCTTDKSVIRGEIEDSLNKGNESLKVQQKKKEETQTLIGNLQKEIDAFNNNKGLLEKKKLYSEQIESLKKELSELKIPEEPVKTDDADYSSQISTLVNTLAVLKNNKDIVRVRSYLDTSRPMLSAYNDLIKLFAPKGTIKEKIAEYYLSAFEEQCNKKASELLPGMSLRFVSDSGISVLTDINGSGNFVTFNSLSGGEKSYVLFLLLDMINALTGLRMMFLDELSVLDKDAFETLVKLIKDNIEDYDLIILATAEHDDTLATLKNYDVNLIDFSTETE